ncbi:MAG: hypothetical protein ACLFVJ_20395 [Persicimonas sp.]
MIRAAIAILTVFSTACATAPEGASDTAEPSEADAEIRFENIEVKP